MSVTQAQYFFTVYVNVKISKERRAQSYGNHSKSFLVFFNAYSWEIQTLYLDHGN